MKKSISILMILLLTVCFASPALGEDTEAVTVTVSVYEHVHERYLAGPESITLPGKKTPLAALQALGLDVEASGGYVREVNGLRERAHGPYSGWVYEVNGVRPPAGAGVYRLKNGDALCWRYAVTAEQAGLQSIATTAQPPVTEKPQAETPPTQPETRRPGGQGSTLPSETSPIIPEKTGALEGTGAALPTETQAETEGASPPAVSMEESIRRAAEWLKEHPGTWAPFALYTAGEDPSAFRESCLQEVTDGLAHASQTDLERYALNLGACGIWPGDIENVLLLSRIACVEENRKQGVNALIYGLITLTAFDEGQGSSLAFTEEILSLQREDGGVSLGDTLRADVDLTAAAAIALVPYREIPGVSEGVNRALSWLRLQQGADGAFSSAISGKNAESTAQALTAFALSGQEMPPEADRAAEALFSFQNADGGFAHLPGGESDSRATEQALIALAAYHGGENPYLFSIPAAEKSSDTLWYWIGGVVVLLALLALGGIIFWRKKHETKPDSSH